MKANELRKQTKKYLDIITLLVGKAQEKGVK